MNRIAPHLFGFQGQVSQSEKEQLLNQRAVCIWLTGLSGSGKSSIGILLETMLHQTGYSSTLLDGDNIRLGINRNLGFSESDREENIRRIAEVNKLFISAGLITINCFVSPSEHLRQLARSIVGKPFLEVFVDTPLELCESRDVKGLYKKARSGELADFTGVSAPFEIPVNPDIYINTLSKTPAESANELFELVIPKIKLS